MSLFQPLFDHMSKEHGLTLLQSEMQEIINIVNAMQAEQEDKPCQHEFISREYSSQPYGHCATCGKTIIT